MGLVIPAGLAASSEAFTPEVGRLYWLESVLLDPADPKPKRPAVVLAISKSPSGEILVALRSTSERIGNPHKKMPAAGLSKDGYFSRSRSINPELWTPDNAKSIDAALGDEDLAYLWADFVTEEVE